MDGFRRRIAVSLFSSYVSQFATTVVNLATKLVLARLIAPNDLGIYSLALVLLLGCDMLVDLGISQHVARERHRPYGNFLLLRMSISAALFIALLAGADVLRFWGAEMPAVTRALAIVVVIKAAAGVPYLYLDRELLIHRSLSPQILRLVLTGAVSLGLAYFRMGVWALVYGTIAGEAVYTATMWQAARGMPIEITWKYSSRLVWGSKFLFLMAWMNFALQQGDKAIVGTLMNGSQVGYYAMAYSIVMLIAKMVESAVYRVIYPTFCEYKDDLEQLGSIYRKATLAIMIIEAPIFFYLLFNAPTLVSMLLGKKWLPAAIIIQVLSISGIINPFTALGYEVLRARKRDGILMLSMVLSAVTLMSSGYILTRRFGTVGMAAAYYIFVGNLPAIVTVYRTIKADFLKLLWEVGLVYAISFTAIAAVSLSLAFAPAAKAAAAGLLIPVCWYTHYRLFDDGAGRRTIGVLLARRETSPSEVSAPDNA
jgi:O-antigen/teichoic acid export membrane protein